MNASYRLNTCKSRGNDIGSLLPLAATGARVRNAYSTCPCPGDSLAKARIIPGLATVPHGIVAIGPPDKDRDASH